MAIETKHRINGRTIYEWKTSDNQPIDQRQYRCVGCFPSRSVVCVHVKELKHRLITHRNAVSASKVSRATAQSSSPGRSQKQQRWIDRVRGLIDLATDEEAMAREEAYKKHLQEMRALKQKADALEKQQKELQEKEARLKRRAEEVVVISVTRQRRFIDLEQEEL